MHIPCINKNSHANKGNIITVGKCLYSPANNVGSFIWKMLKLIWVLEYTDAAPYLCKEFPVLKLNDITIVISLKCGLQIEAGLWTNCSHYCRLKRKVVSFPKIADRKVFPSIWLLPISWQIIVSRWLQATGRDVLQDIIAFVDLKTCLTRNFQYINDVLPLNQYNDIFCIWWFLGFIKPTSASQNLNVLNNIYIGWFARQSSAQIFPALLNEYGAINMPNRQLYFSHQIVLHIVD